MMFTPRQLQIHPEYLAEQWQEQAKWMDDAGRDLAGAKFALSETKRDFDLTEAKLALAIRKNPVHYGLDKATDKSVEACVVTQDELQESSKAVNKAKYDVDIREALVNALIDRRKGLEDHAQLIQLGLCQIHTTPKSYPAPAPDRRRKLTDE